MLLTITTTHPPAGDLGYLLHKHPERFQSFDLSFGKAHVYYSEVGPQRCTACLLLDVDPVGMVRGKSPDQHFLLAQYVNDRPYAASSFLSVAISQVFGSALQGRCQDRPELVATPIPLTARIDVLPVRGGERFLRAVFEPLGYEVEATRYPLDEKFPDWGDSPYFSVTVRKTATLADLLTHLYVLIPVFDSRKHYFVGADELEKLLVKGEGWLAQHPVKEEIARRYLRFQPSLYRMALARLVQEEEPVEGEEEEPRPQEQAEQVLEKPLSLREQRLGAVMAALRASGARRVLDLGCGAGSLLRELLKDRQFEEIVGLDVSIRSLEAAQRRLKLERLAPAQANRLQLFHGSLMYRDRRLEGFDAAAVVEVIEHLDPPRLAAFERVLFEFASPRPWC
jgi:3' terminal RNA ribose 2'-O-methyltransferase Hen1